MRRFNKISPNIWMPGRFSQLPSQDAKFLHLYLLTCSHQNIAGCFVLRYGYATADLDWAIEKYQIARQQVMDGDLISFDAATSEIFVHGWFRHNPPMNAPHKLGIERQIACVQSGALRKLAEEELSEVCEAIPRGEIKISNPRSSFGGANRPDLRSTRHLTEGK